MIKGKTILVTGGAGFIGSHIVDRLVKMGARPVVIDNFVSGKIENIEHCAKKIKIIQGDITNECDLQESMKGVDYVIHQAALRSVPKSFKMPDAYIRVNVMGTQMIMEAACKMGVKKVVMASSSSVYGKSWVYPQAEEVDSRPISPYALSKLLMEDVARFYTRVYKIKTACLRYFNVFGERQSLEDEYPVAIPKFISCVRNGQAAPIYGDGTQERDFTYVGNVVNANIRALETNNYDHVTLNIGNGNPVSINRLLDTVCECFKAQRKAQYLPPRAGDVLRTHANIRNARSAIGWQPEISFEEGIKRTINGIS